VPRLAGAAVAATVMGDATVSTRGQEHHLVFPGVRSQRPAVTEDDGLSRSPILVVEVDGRRVFSTDGDTAHHATSLVPPAALRSQRAVEKRASAEGFRGPTRRSSAPRW